MNPERGKPGEPGKDAIGREGGKGGKGGEGGAGGIGLPIGGGGIGGAGGEGGKGAQGIQGPQGPQGPPGDVERYHIWRWRFMSLWIVVFTALVSFALWQNHNLSIKTKDRNQQIVTVLCLYREDLQQRLDSNEVLLRNPSGFGLTPAAVIVLRTTDVSLSSSINTLKGLKCSAN